MNPTDMIFNAISQLTGGLIADLSTAIIAMIMLSFIAMGFDYLLDILDNRIKSTIAHKQLTGRYSAPKIDDQFLENGKLTMEPNKSSREVPYRF